MKQSFLSLNHGKTNVKHSKLQSVASRAGLGCTWECMHYVREKVNQLLRKKKINSTRKRKQDQKYYLHKQRILLVLHPKFWTSRVSWVTLSIATERKWQASNWSSHCPYRFVEISASHSFQEPEVAAFTCWSELTCWLVELIKLTCST